ncbi:hypothetical protein MFLAVUS_000025 [Mucor flavus]|uniref:MULE transposase domain-containing protein n=1 Tax=Mucor flavus TaxID=439312 RepID=A0ABP9YIJ9_9FUNG
MFSQTKSTRESMHAEFNRIFGVGKQFENREELNESILKFGKTFNHGGIKREEKRDPDVIDLVNCSSGFEQEVDKIPYKKSMQKFSCPAFISTFNFTVTKNRMGHNHPISQDVTTYAIHRKQPPEIMQLIYTWLSSGHKDPTTSAMDSIGYVIRIQTKPDQEVRSVFFIHEKVIKEVRLRPEAITVDATYKTNAHKLSLVNIVGTSNASSVKSVNRLQTFAIVAAFVNNETEQTYTVLMGSNGGFPNLSYRIKKSQLAVFEIPNGSFVKIKWQIFLVN